MLSVVVLSVVMMCALASYKVRLPKDFDRKKSLNCL